MGRSLGSILIDVTLLISLVENIWAEIILRILVFFFYLYTEHLEPFVRHIEKEELWLYKNPETPSYVPIHVLWVIVVVVPLSGILIAYVYSRNKMDVLQALLGLTLSVFLSASLTNIIKVIVGRPRPDFFWRCFPNGVYVENMECTGHREKIIEGRKSFPSGHSTIAFSGLGYTTFYLLGKLHCFNQNGRGYLWRLLVSFVPVFLALIVALSRTCDYHHHWQDVTIGSLLGLSVAYCCYRQAYPAFSCCTSHLPYFCSHSSDDTNHDNRISNLSRPSSTPVILTSAQKFSEDSFKYV
ncbi:DPP1 [Acanthosepion pharaonis]|uniref:DPP1 n=1 Tax=Acanthosepion pharaonis TaxID=158019 RepID=A0A812DDD0_ACAPH|nr:DPP1 [Sepia pharaonis]